MKIAGPSSKIMAAITVAFSLSGMILSRAMIGANSKATLVGIIGFILFALLYSWAEQVSTRPRFLWIPLFWLIWGLGMKGEGLILGLPIHLILSLSFRKHYETRDSHPKDVLETEDALVDEKES